MGNNIKSFNEEDYVQVVRAYLIEGNGDTASL